MIGLIGSPAGKLYYVRSPKRSAKGDRSTRLPRRARMNFAAFSHKITKADLYRSELLGGDDELACKDALSKLPHLLKDWLPLAKKTLWAVDHKDLERPRPSDEPFATRLRMVVLVVQIVAEAVAEVERADALSEKKGPPDPSRRREILFAVAGLLQRSPTAQELAWATILCGVVPRDLPTEARPWELLNRETKAALQTLGRRAKQLPKAQGA